MIRFNRFEESLRQTIEDPSVSGWVAPTTGSTTGTNNNNNDKKPPMSVETFRENFREEFGELYMSLHGISSGNMQDSSSVLYNTHVEDARTILRAFWIMSETRLYGDVESSVDQIILQKLSVSIETEFLAKIQEWGVNETSVANLLAESESIRKERTKLSTAKEQYSEALSLIRNL